MNANSTESGNQSQTCGPFNVFHLSWVKEIVEQSQDLRYMAVIFSFRIHVGKDSNFKKQTKIYHDFGGVQGRIVCF